MNDDPAATETITKLTAVQSANLSRTLGLVNANVGILDSVDHEGIFR
jgi:hypothetical protein